MLSGNMHIQEILYKSCEISNKHILKKILNHKKINKSCLGCKNTMEQKGNIDRGDNRTAF